MKRQHVSGPPLQRAIDASVTVLDEESRLVRLSFSSETPYTRSSWFDEPWIEVLGHKPEEVDFSRLNGGAAPVTYNHNTSNPSQLLGIVEKAWLENSRGIAEVRFSKRAEVDGFWQDIVDGILKSVSVSYQIQERVLTKKNDKGPSEYRVTKWLPIELGPVAIPADATVGIGRSDDTSRNYTITDLNDEEHDMAREHETDTPADQLTPNQPAPNQPETRTAADVDAARTAAIQAERQRSTDIQDVVAKAKLSAELARTWITEGITVEVARQRAFDELAQRDVHHTAHIEVTKDQQQKTREAAESWLLFRAGERVDGKAIEINGNPFRGLSLIDIARRGLVAVGERIEGLTSMEIVQRAITHTTSDFTVVLENALNKVLLSAYTLQPDTWSRFCQIGQLSDFRAHNRYHMGSFSDLTQVNEAGEFEDGTIADAEKQTITGITKGKILNLSRQIIINDDLGAFLGIARALGRAANRTVEKDVYALLALNSGMGPTMSDGNALFHANHANIASSAGAPAVATFDNARVMMASQMDVGSNDYLDIRPAVWLGPTSLGGTARVTNDAQYDPDTANKLQRPNMVRGLFSDIVDTPRLSGTPWYAFADPSQEPVIEVAFLNGQRTPYLEMQDGFRVDGVSWKVRLDYGVGAVGWRGAIRNAGV